MDLDEINDAEPRNGRLCFRIVLCGPGCSGKSSLLKFIHSQIDPGRAEKLVSLDTDTGRTLFFDYLPVDLGLIPEIGRPVRLDFYTSPGQAFYDEARRLVLRGADAVAFVADSDPARAPANLEALENLKQALAAWGMSYDETPLVFVYNKRDLPDAVPLEDLRAALNPGRRRPDFRAIASVGKGVRSLMEALCTLVFERRLAVAGSRQP